MLAEPLNGVLKKGQNYSFKLFTESHQQKCVVKMVSKDIKKQPTMMKEDPKMGSLSNEVEGIEPKP